MPVNITYYPLRPGDNKIKSLATRLIKNLPKQIAEELEIEGNILLNSEIDLNFGDPINLQDYISSTKNIIDKTSNPAIKARWCAGIFLSKIYDIFNQLPQSTGWIAAGCALIKTRIGFHGGYGR